MALVSMEPRIGVVPTAGRVFATTNWSLVLAAGQGDSNAASKALETLCHTYWPAIYIYVRRVKPDPETARDLTQEFFLRLLAKGWLEVADQNKGRFRTFLLTLLKHFLADQYDHDKTQKRGGGQILLSLDELAAEEERPFEPSCGLTPAQEFDRRWALATLDTALRNLRGEAERTGHGDLFAALQGFLSGGEGDATLSETGRRFGLGGSAVKMRLHRWRNRYREILREQVAQTVPRLADLDEELRHLLAAISS
jgi:RNA polymerase sigma factor (sigma-70 family)